MAVAPLPNLPDRTFVCIDANIFVYALTGQSAQCRQLIERCVREEVTGVVLFETVNEVAHRFMIAEAEGVVPGKQRFGFRTRFGYRGF
jgi:predicted nucleic acid-binding protein